MAPVVVLKVSIVELSLRYTKRKFSSISYPVSTSVSLCKYLTKTKKIDNVHGFGKVVQWKKRKERENEENEGKQKVFFGIGKVVKSKQDEFCLNLPQTRKS